MIPSKKGIVNNDNLENLAETHIFADSVLPYDYEGAKKTEKTEKRAESESVAKKEVNENVIKNLGKHQIEEEFLAEDLKQRKKDQVGVYSIWDEDLPRIPILEDFDVHEGDEEFFANLEKTCFFKEIQSRTKRVLKRRSKPARIYTMLLTSLESGLLRLRMLEHANITNLYIILESSISNSNKEKPLFVEPHVRRLQQLSREHPSVRFMYVPVRNYPKDDVNVHFKIENFLMNSLLELASFYARETGASDSDLLLFHHADEIPSRDLLNVVKYYEGFDDRMLRFSYRWNLYNFGYRNDPKMKFQRCVGGSLKYFLAELDRSAKLGPSVGNAVTDYLTSCDKKKETLDLTVYDRCTMGFHCTWCFELQNHRLKAIHMTSSYLRDKQMRVFDDIDLVKQYVDKGVWWENLEPIEKDAKEYLSPNVWTDMHAPLYLRMHPEEFDFLIPQKFKDECPDWIEVMKEINQH